MKLTNCKLRHIENYQQVKEHVIPTKVTLMLSIVITKFLNKSMINFQKDLTVLKSLTIINLNKREELTTKNISNYQRTNWLLNGLMMNKMNMSLKWKRNRRLRKKKDLNKLSILRVSSRKIKPRLTVIELKFLLISRRSRLTNMNNLFHILYHLNET